jgi:quercetin dioxygenase-like cupin family protein
MRDLISEKDGAPNFRLRHFVIEPGGHTPLHRHDWEHENYFISEKGILVTERGILR